MLTPKRPALRYYGGKWRIAPWIISHFPPHKNYLEPCGGAASVLLQKERSPLETYNDLDGNVVNFFRVLRDRPDTLIEKLRLTPWAREEYLTSLQPVIGPMRDSDREVEQARRFFVSMWMSMQGGHHEKTSKTFKIQKRADYVYTLSCQQWVTYRDLSFVALRFDGVQIENRSALDIIPRYDNEDALIYFDPPYVAETRSQDNIYCLEVSEQFHVDAAALLRDAMGFVVVSGYACPLYTELYEVYGWHRVDKETQTNSGGKRIESLWLSPRTYLSLRQDFTHLPLFDIRRNT